MLFNAPSFLFLFLPVTLAGYLILRNRWHTASLAWLACASFVFYGAWHIGFIPILIGSLLFNASLTHFMATAKAYRRVLLIFGLTSNLALLGYFKYANFFVDVFQQVSGSTYPWVDVVLPVGLSFFTFQQIAFLVDQYRNESTERSFLRYALFIMFFPQLIAGPIVHHKEMMPQFAKRKYARLSEDMLSGLTLLLVGLVKKMAIADTAALIASPIFHTASQGTAPSFGIAWVGAFAYAVQIYADFSAYSDMAIGLGRLFGINLPINFASPYKARSIPEFWQRWHITLSRFLRDYLYIPLGGSKRGKYRHRLNLMITMILGGFWHGAGWTYLLWGGLHGCFLLVHHLWKDTSFAGSVHKAHGWKWIAQGITLLAVVVAWVPFRATDLGTTARMWQGMAGLGIPENMDVWAPLLASPFALSTTLIGFILAVGTRNIYQRLSFLRLGMASRNYPATHITPSAHFPRWYGRWPHAFMLGAAITTVILKLNDVSEFIYFQF